VSPPPGGKKDPSQGSVDIEVQERRKNYREERELLKAMREPKKAPVEIKDLRKIKTRTKKEKKMVLL